MPDASPNPIILYDGVCGLCNRLVQFVLKRDSADRFRFASLQSDFTAKLLQGGNIHPENLDTIYVVVDAAQPSERVLSRSNAVIFILRELGWFWNVPAGLLRLLPRQLCDWGYNLVARNRYRLFGKHDSCALPAAKHRAKFLDQ